MGPYPYKYKASTHYSLPKMASVSHVDIAITGVPTTTTRKAFPLSGKKFAYNKKSVNVSYTCK